MNRQLASAVLFSFHDDDPDRQRESLKRFSSGQWKRALYWLDASGLALYFLRRAKELELADAMPAPILHQLEERHGHNLERTASLLREFARINEIFRNAQLHYANLKGPTLLPDYCADLSSRYQSDLDFLVARGDTQRCHDLLAGLGYRLMAATDEVMEFKTHSGHLPRIRDLYKAKLQQSVEVHVCDDSRFDLQCARLQRARMMEVEGQTCPALAEPDMFLSQSFHLFRHLCSEWTRISWLLEFRHYVVLHRNDAGLWQDICRMSADSPEAPIAVGLAIALAEVAFGEFAPDELTNWSSRRLKPELALWIRQYGRRVLLSQFPGSKLYLILKQELDHKAYDSHAVRRRLFPLHMPPAVVAAFATDRRMKVRNRWEQFKYFAFRLRFHMAAGAQYLLEQRRWKVACNHLLAATSWTTRSGALKARNQVGH